MIHFDPKVVNELKAKAAEVPAHLTHRNYVFVSKYCIIATSSGYIIGRIKLKHQCYGEYLPEVHRYIRVVHTTRREAEEKLGSLMAEDINIVRLYSGV